MCKKPIPEQEDEELWNQFTVQSKTVD